MTERLDAPRVIGRKRDGEELSAAHLRAFLDGYLAGDVAEEQMSAFLMAGVLQGFSTAEAVAMTEIMVASGDQVDLSDLAGPTVDKHSTGGVGDTCTLVVAPILAACGVQVAKLSGRGLGHTGGTLDKLEAIPGFTVALDPERLHDQVEDIGLAVAAATADLVPLDKRLYALRDVTATVPSPALIAASVMSKKLAGGAQHVLLDVKCGDGAFMQDPTEAADLARLCVDIGRAHGRRTGALVTDMSQPLSAAIGNAIEVAHAIEVLTGERHGRFRDLCVDLAAAALVLTGVEATDAHDRTVAALDGGQAAASFTAMVRAQGGDPAVTGDPWGVLPAAPHIVEVPLGPGTVERWQCRRLGEVAAGLGAGRSRKEDTVDLAVGLEVLAPIGATVDGTEPTVRIHARTSDDAERAAAQVTDLVTLADGDVSAPDLVLAEVGIDHE